MTLKYKALVRAYERATLATTKNEIATRLISEQENQPWYQEFQRKYHPTPLTPAAPWWMRWAAWLGVTW